MTTTRLVWLRDLPKGRLFSLDGRKYRVIRNGAPQFMSVQSLAERWKEIHGRKFKTRKNPTETWAANVLVEVERTRRDRKPTLPVADRAAVPVAGLCEAARSAGLTEAGHNGEVTEAGHDGEVAHA